MKKLIWLNFKYQFLNITTNANDSDQKAIPSNNSSGRSGNEELSFKIIFKDGLVVLGPVSCELFYGLAT
jgi:hypothetical protein